MLSYLFSKLNKITEKQKGKIKQNKEKNLPLAQGRGPLTSAGPAHLEGVTFVFFPSRQAGTSPATAVGTTGSCLPAPSLISSLETSRRRPDPSPFLQSLFLLLPCSFPSPTEDPPEHRSAPAWPSTPRNPAELSSVFAILDCVAEKKESSQGAPELPPPSSSSTPAAVDRVQIPATPAPPRASHHSRSIQGELTAGTPHFPPRLLPPVDFAMDAGA